jgi:hypothetical protein
MLDLNVQIVKFGTFLYAIGNFIFDATLSAH